MEFTTTKDGKYSMGSLIMRFFGLSPKEAIEFLRDYKRDAQELASAIARQYGIAPDACTFEHVPF